MTENFKFPCPKCGEKSFSIAAEIDNKKRHWDFGKPTYVDTSSDDGTSFESICLFVTTFIILFSLLNYLFPVGHILGLYAPIGLFSYLLYRRIKARKKEKTKVEKEVSNKPSDEEVFKHNLSLFNKIRFCENCNVLFDDAENVRDANQFGFSDLMNCLSTNNPIEDEKNK